MIQRAVSQLVKEKLGTFPAVALLGPRQSGKTTLAKTFSSVYFDLEQPEDQLRLDLEWGRLVNSGQLVILDEAQNEPSVFPRIRGAIDSARRKNGRFLLLGSIAPALMKNVSESLAGRLALCELSPIQLIEAKKKVDEDELWLLGGFPDGGILKRKQFPAWQKDYLALLAQRDLPHWGLPARPQTTLKFFKMLAASNGQLWNASTVGASMGLSYHTVNDYLDYLENAFLLTRLLPYHANLPKRLIKSPRVFWNDSGLLHALLGVTDRRMLLSQPWVGASWEGWAMNQIVSSLKARGKPFEAYFFRTSDGHEIDLVLKFPRGLWAFEFKLSASPGPEDFKKLNAAADLIKAEKRILVTKTPHPYESKSFVSSNIRHCLEYL